MKTIVSCSPSPNQGQNYCDSHWVIFSTQSSPTCTKYELLFVFLEQIWTLVPGTSRLRSVLCGPTSNASTVAAMTRATATQTSCLWTIVCRVSWDSGWTCPRTSKWIMTFGWSGKSSPNLFPGRNCYSENQPNSFSQEIRPTVLSLINHRSQH